MGYLRQHAIVVTGHYGDHIDRAHAKALELFAPDVIHLFGQPDTAMVTPILTSPVNNSRSFAILPDGSKEGWGTSDNGDSARNQFVAWLRAQAYDDGSNPLAYAEVQYGDDNRESKLVRSSDRDCKRKRVSHRNAV